jgi:GntR family transcriptional repressor for pyruvate dehydrogenase complex
MASKPERMAQFAGIVTATLPRQIAERIREAIVAGELKVDEQLPTEEAMAERFGVSRSTIREALKRLAAENLVHSRRGPTGGTFLKRPRPDEVGESLSSSVRLLASLGEFILDDIVEARFRLGSLCCELAAQRGKAVHFAAMRTEIAVQRAASLSDVDFCASDVRFHQALVNATGNSVFCFLLPALNAALQPVTNLLVYRFRERRVIADQHERIVTALEAADSAEAIEMLRTQCDYLQSKLADAQAWRSAQPRRDRRG